MLEVWKILSGTARAGMAKLRVCCDQANAIIASCYKELHHDQTNLNAAFIKVMAFLKRVGTITKD